MTYKKHNYLYVGLKYNDPMQLLKSLTQLLTFNYYDHAFGFELVFNLVIYVSIIINDY